MKRLVSVGMAGLALACLSYFLVYCAATAPWRRLPQSATPGLAWLKEEFHLGDAEFQRIRQLHEAYLPACQERCRKIDAKNAELRGLIAKSGAVTPEAERALAEAAALRSECQAAMLKHFVEVSRAMPPEQGRRYLDWICARTLTPEHTTMAPSATAPAHEHPGH
jgi:hypothetical protein